MAEAWTWDGSDWTNRTGAPARLAVARRCQQLGWQAAFPSDIIGTYQIARVAFAACDPTWRDLLEAFQGISAIAPQLPEREQLGGPYGALAYVLHLTRSLRQWPGAYVVHDRLAPAQMALSRRFLERPTLQRLAGDDASLSDVAHALWADVCRIADRPSR